MNNTNIRTQKKTPPKERPRDRLLLGRIPVGNLGDLRSKKIRGILDICLPYPLVDLSLDNFHLSFQRAGPAAVVRDDLSDGRISRVQGCIVELDMGCVHLYTPVIIQGSRDRSDVELAAVNGCVIRHHVMPLIRDAIGSSFLGIIKEPV